MSFTKGIIMQIKINLKEKNIEDIKIGDIVKSYDIDTASIVYKSVTDIFNPKVKESYLLKFNNGAEYTCSNTHKWWDEKSEKWISTEKLTLNETFIDEHNKEVLLDFMIKVETESNFYDFTVKDTNCYFVGETNKTVLTHNSATCHFQLWHYEIEDLLVLKNNKGTADNRIRKMDYSIQINNYLYNRFIQNKNITLFSPHDVKDMYDAFFADQKKFAQLYEQYEQDPNIRKKTINARELFTKLMVERKETGRIYIFNVDNVNDHSSFTVPITQSNLCQEITLFTSPLKDLNDSTAHTALCTLASINLGVVKNLDDLEPICRNVVRGLDNLLSYQTYMLPSAENSNRMYRTLGVGITNMAYYLAKNGVRYADKEAHQLLHDMMEAVSYYCLKASIELAKERGPCEGLANTKYGQGLLPIDHYNKNVDQIVPPVYKLDWEALRVDLKKYGIRNATLMAIAPVETSSKILNSTNGVEAPRALITTKSSKANVTRQVVPEYSKLKNKYDLLWDMKSNEGVIKCMAVLTKFIDQSISTNLNYNPVNYENNEIPMSVLLKDLLMCNKMGLKTIYYHNSNDQRDIEVKSNTPVVETVVESVQEEEQCESCSI